MYDISSRPMTSLSAKNTIKSKRLVHKSNIFNNLINSKGNSNEKIKQKFDPVAIRSDFHKIKKKSM